VICDIENMEIQDIKNGFVCDDKSAKIKCIFCGEEFEPGVIYNFLGQLVDAKKAAELHIKNIHGSVFSMLLLEDKRQNGLTDVQKNFLADFYAGKSDADIAAKTNTSQSTVRYQRFNFREKAKQAKVLLAVSELLVEKQGSESDVAMPHKGATMVDERYMTSSKEVEKIIKSFFVSVTPPVLKNFSPKEKNKLVISKIIAGQFEQSKKYSENDVNDILKKIYDDYVTIRRYLIEYGFMDRTADCSEYWLK